MPIPAMMGELSLSGSTFISMTAIYDGSNVEDAMRVEDGRSYANKEEVARRLIHSGIRNILLGECPFATHLLLGSATNLLNEYAKAAGKEALLDVGKWARPEFAKGMKEALSSHYNFFKHANFDADMSIDVTNLSQSNELAAFGAIMEYRALFAISTHQMSLYFTVITIEYPDLYNWDLLEAENPRAAAMRSQLKSRGKDEAFRLARNALDLPPQLEEVLADRKPIYRETGPYYEGPPHRDMFKRKL